VGSPDKEVKVKYLVYLLEKAIKAMDESQGVEKIVWVIDYSGFSQIAGMSMTKISMEIVGILQDHYPGTLVSCHLLNILVERLGQAFLFHAPWVWTVSFFGGYSLLTNKDILEDDKSLSQ
jgi:hypothetical protein